MVSHKFNKLVAHFTAVSFNLKPVKCVIKLVIENYYITGLINKIIILLFTFIVCCHRDH